VNGRGRALDVSAASGQSAEKSGHPPPVLSFYDLRFGRGPDERRARRALVPGFVLHVTGPVIRVGVAAGGHLAVMQDRSYEIRPDGTFEVHVSQRSPPEVGDMIRRNGKLWRVKARRDDKPIRPWVEVAEQPADCISDQASVNRGRTHERG
jgi:hypothetical protein